MNTRQLFELAQHTLKLVPGSQRELFISEMGTHVENFIIKARQNDLDELIKFITKAKENYPFFVVDDVIRHLKELKQNI